MTSTGTVVVIPAFAKSISPDVWYLNLLINFYIPRIDCGSSFFKAKKKSVATLMAGTGYKEVLILSVCFMHSFFDRNKGQCP